MSKLLLRLVGVLIVAAVIGLAARVSMMSKTLETPIVVHGVPRIVTTADQDTDRLSTTSSNSSATRDSSSIDAPATTEAPARLDESDSTSPPSRAGAVAADHDVVHVALISHGWKAAGYENEDTIKGRKRSVELTLKGIFRLQKTCPVHVHFITGLEDETRIRAFLHSHVNTTAVQSSFSFHELDEAQLGRWMDAIGHKASHRTGAAGNIKFFYPLFFPEVERLIMLDTDVLIGRDIYDMWRFFDSFGKDQLFAFAPQWPKYDAVKDNQLNAGVALLHLERMRRANWLELSRKSIANWQAKDMKPPCCAHGDQSVFHMIRFYNSSTLRLLPRWWNINKCHQYQNIHKNPKGSFVGIVHLGCCKMCTRQKIGPRWSALLDDIDAWHPEKDLATNRFPFEEVDGKAFQ